MTQKTGKRYHQIIKNRKKKKKNTMVDLNLNISLH